VFLSKISLQNFKNYSRLSLQFPKGIQFITGPNGTGKTNLLDAIHYLSLGKSYLHAGDRQAIKLGETAFGIQGEFTKEQPTSIKCKYSEAEGKEICRNQVVCNRLADHIGEFPVVMITPDDHLLIDEGSEERRKLMDVTLSQISRGYLQELNAYNKILMQRNAAIKQLAGKHTLDYDLMHSFNEKLSLHGEKIHEARKQYAKQVVPFFQSYYHRMIDKQEEVYAEYHSALAEFPFLTLLDNTLQADLQQQRTTQGIHRDDLLLFLNGNPVKKFGSQGQKKCVLLALKLAQHKLIAEETGITPLLLVDDVFDKLDEIRSQKLLQLFTSDEFIQIFLTDSSGKISTQISEANTWPLTNWNTAEFVSVHSAR
jgi:DNA replication and repair protein RecF